MLDSTHFHAMVVHFPIALVIVGFASEIAGVFFKKDFFATAGLYLLTLGAVSAGVAYFSGDLAGDGVSESGALKKALETHEEAAGLALWALAFATAARLALAATGRYRGALKAVSLVLFFIGVLAVGRTGYYGGQLVFNHAAGVQFNLGFEFNSGEPSENQSHSPHREAEEEDM